MQQKLNKIHGPSKYDKFKKAIQKFNDPKGVHEISVHFPCLITGVVDVENESNSIKIKTNTTSFDGPFYHSGLDYIFHNKERGSIGRRLQYAWRLCDGSEIADFGTRQDFGFLKNEDLIWIR
ncbi:hypothetical protein [Pseudobacteriovorax antillogorgiicola]|uniref:Uncharacterized protein n=1 Tax=Pseudobacteriovorax antillogorgiicola TaxID=1513793 RepID=A0A1Y6B838_9BACT|nr:hypothetical protein [Pseudobacteriovorax antillogorgiicola]TCS58751.1 hypothetical protein EDD56_102265 [Pseudobacteriovorax antillogorgiicola]SME95165.1 hypothetical protein SAMN06296036_102178 [Pseudobacteriovorax antillogorgiicola]